MNQVTPFQEDRLGKWIKISHQISYGNAVLAHTIQSLGSYDLELIERADEIIPGFIDYINTPNRGPRTVEENYLLDKLISLSRLWVLGAYEDLRTSHTFAIEKARTSEDDRFRVKAERIKNVKLLFARVRVPLSKYEPSDRHRETDSQLALPVLDKSRGLAWKINNSLILSRGELADAFLGLHEEKDTLSQ